MTFPGGGTTTFGGGTAIQAVERQTQVAEWRSGPFRLNLITASNSHAATLSLVYDYSLYSLENATDNVALMLCSVDGK